MNVQDLPFEPRKLARTENPPTSKAAAVDSRSLRGEHHRAILEVLASLTSPMTCEDIAYALGFLDRHQVGRRMGELHLAGLAITVGQKVISTGRSARCWRPAPAG